MPRPLRIAYENAWYHVMNRGAGHKNIFQTTEHRNLFLVILSKTSELFDIEVHAYCLMNNHYHLLIKTPRGNLSRAMRHINGIYTQRYNKSVKKDGSLFRGRYKAILIEKDGYLLNVSRYIHLNPIQAKLVKLPHQYKWSSYQYYLNNKKPSWLHTQEILSMACEVKPKAKISYKKFVESGLDNETRKFFNKIHLPVVFGSKQFKKRVLSTLDDKYLKEVNADYNRTRILPKMDKIDAVCVSYFKLDKAQLYKSQRGKNNEMRKIAIYACRQWCTEKLSVIAKRYQFFSHSCVSNIVKNIEERVKKDKKLQKMLKDIRQLVDEEECVK